MTFQEAFERYMVDVFGEPFDDSDLRHLTMQAVFKAGYLAGWNSACD